MQQAHRALQHYVFRAHNNAFTAHAAQIRDVIARRHAPAIDQNILVPCCVRRTHLHINAETAQRYQQSIECGHRIHMRFARKIERRIEPLS